MSIPAIMVSIRTHSSIPCLLAWCRRIHLAGGITVNEESVERPFLADTHSHPVPDAALDLLDSVLENQAPATIILERDDRLNMVDELLDDLRRIRRRVAARAC